MIEAYVSKVTSYLPFSKRKEVTLELTSNIYEALGQDYTQEDLLSYLKSLGHPRDFAQEFSDDQYLIGPMYFGKFKELLMLVCKISLPIIAIFPFIDSMFNPKTNSIIVDIFIALFVSLGSLLTGFISLLGILVIIFYFLEKKESTIELHEFDFESLKVKEVKSSSLTESIISLIGISLGSIFILFPGLISIYRFSNGQITQIPIFDFQGANLFLLLLGSYLLISLIGVVIRIYNRRESKTTLMFEFLGLLFMTNILLLALKNNLYLSEPVFGYVKDFYMQIKLGAMLILLISYASLIFNVFKLRKVN